MHSLCAVILIQPLPGCSELVKIRESTSPLKHQQRQSLVVLQTIIILMITVSTMYVHLHIPLDNVLTGGPIEFEKSLLDLTTL